MWRWLDRERRLAAEMVFAKEKARESRQWFGLWRDVCAKLDIARAERAQALVEVKDLKRQLDAVNLARQSARMEHFGEVKRIQDERQRWERLAEQAIIPPPSTPIRPDDRAGLYRLEQENERLRAQLADERAAHDRTRIENIEFIERRHNPLRDEYLTERARLMDELAKYEGNPS